MPSVPTTVLCHLPDGYLHLGELEGLFPAVKFVQVPTSGPVPPGVSGEVLVTMAGPSDNLVDLLGRGVRWVHCTGHGVDHRSHDLEGGSAGPRALRNTRIYRRE